MKTTVHLDIAAKTLGDRTATVAVLNWQGQKKALVRVGSDQSPEKAFREAIGRLTRPAAVVFRANRNAAKLRDAVLAENSRGVHSVFFTGGADLGWLEILAYEFALQNGTDPVTMREVVERA